MLQVPALFKLNVPVDNILQVSCGWKGAVIGTDSTVWGDKMLYGQIPDPFPRCGIGSGHARLSTLLQQPHSLAIRTARHLCRQLHYWERRWLFRPNICRQNREVAEAGEESKATCNCICSCYWEQMNGNRVNWITCKTRNIEWNAMQNGMDWNAEWNMEGMEM